MKKVLLTTICTMLAFSASAASTTTETKTNSYYTELRLNSNFGEFDALNSIGVSDNGVIGGALAIGTKLDNIFRVELEGWYNDDFEFAMNTDRLARDIDESLAGFLAVDANIETKSKGFFLNAYFDIPLDNVKKWKPYVGGGIGYSYLKSSIDVRDGGYPLFRKSYSDHDWAWNIGLGVAYELRENIDLTLGYRHESLGTLKLAETLPVKCTNDKVSLGLRLSF